MKLSFFLSSLLQQNLFYQQNQQNNVSQNYYHFLKKETTSQQLELPSECTCLQELIAYRQYIFLNFFYLANSDKENEPQKVLIIRLFIIKITVMESTFFFLDFSPSQQEWSQVNQHIEKDLSEEPSLYNIIFTPFDQTPDDPISQPEIFPTDEHSLTTNDQPPKPQSNYQKNICSYISKKIVQHLINPKSEKFVRKLCLKSGCHFQDAIRYYARRSKQIFGINHLSMMITPQNEEQINIKKMFCVFLNWFLRNKYMYYMLKYGKMEEKQKYLEFKNKYLLYIVNVEPKFERYL